MMPTLNYLETGDDEYYWYIGDRIGSVSLWVRNAGTEFPIYQNTRGQGVWNSADPDTHNQDRHEPTQAFWDAVDQLSQPDVDEIDVEDCEWWERECIRSIIGMVDDENATPEMSLLLNHAEEQAEQ